MQDNDYTSTISELTNRFMESIEDNEDRLELEEKFKSYLETSIKTIEKSESKFVDKDKESIINVLRALTENLLQKKLFEKKQELLEDDSYEKIRKISAETFSSAINVLQGKKEKTDVKYDEKEIQMLLDSVKDFNKERAEALVSDTILDLQFLSNPKTDLLSLRLEHEKNAFESENKNIKEEER